jgi:hypothetical protein
MVVKSAVRALPAVNVHQSLSVRIVLNEMNVLIATGVSTLV